MRVLRGICSSVRCDGMSRGVSSSDGAVVAGNE
jgi:hypothetical protein